MIIFLSGWPLVYFLRFARYLFYGLYRICDYGYAHLSKERAASTATASAPSPPSTRRQYPKPSAPPSYT